jgi:hypothetical protein
MTRDEWAAKLNGREYHKEMTKQEEKAAEKDGMLIVFGASDDLIELRGTDHEEVGAYDGTEFCVDKEGKLLVGIDEDDREVLQKHAVLEIVEARYKHNRIIAEWNCKGYLWFIGTGFGLPFAPFDILEDGEKYCRGIVISKADLK